MILIYRLQNSSRIIPTLPIATLKEVCFISMSKSALLEIPFINLHISRWIDGVNLNRSCRHSAQKTNETHSDKDCLACLKKIKIIQAKFKGVYMLSSVLIHSRVDWFKGFIFENDLWQKQRCLK